MPPKGLRQRVRVVQDHGEVVMSVGPVRLAAGAIGSTWYKTHHDMTIPCTAIMCAVLRCAGK